MKYLSIKNFEKHQHYKDRRPSWIKLYAEVLDDYEFVCLQDASRSHLMLLWVLASKLNNRIPYDMDYIAKAIKSTTPLDVEHLITQGFVQVSDAASKPLASRTQSATLETETETETELTSVAKANGSHLLKSYSVPFLELRRGYPKRAGGDSEADAHKQYLARLKTGETHEAIAAGVARYKTYCDAMGKTGTEYVKQMCTFLGKSRHYLEPWEIAQSNGHLSKADRDQIQFKKMGYV